MSGDCVIDQSNRSLKFFLLGKENLEFLSLVPLYIVLFNSKWFFIHIKGIHSSYTVLMGLALCIDYSLLFGGMYVDYNPEYINLFSSFLCQVGIPAVVKISVFRELKLGIIRLLLAIAVCNSHFELTSLPMVDGHEAVLTFFAVSGFYMAMILEERKESPGCFYKSRILSLYPMFLFAVGVSAAILFFLDAHPLISRAQVVEILSNPSGFFIVLWTSVCVVGQELLFSLGGGEGGSLHFISGDMPSIYNHVFLVQAWSLSLEIVFYSLAPFLVRLNSKILLGLSFVSLLFRVFIVLTPLSDQSFFLRFFPADFWLFGFGIISYRFYRGLSKKVSIVDYLAFISLIALVMIAGGVSNTYVPFFLPMGAIVLQPFIFRAFQSLVLDCVVGKVTYPFYLLHYAVIGLFEEYADDPLGWHIFAVSMAAALVAFLIFSPGIGVLRSKVRRRASGNPILGTA
ncbi:acyltransferase family protein [Maridesulfovibrio salexigens]|uniref:acyltransferase family protein n=1 Tax=Maridesulfovibrio salexigens TaxID=880 RepID=UPI0018D37F93|nr:acyltransferase [Maridesulfovibrio salexigens]